MKRFIKLLGIGFLTAFVTVIDDTIAYSSLFLKSISLSFYAIIGIYIATTIELFVIIHFAKKISKVPYKKEISAIGLVILGILILLEII